MSNTATDIYKDFIRSVYLKSEPESRKKAGELFSVIYKKSDIEIKILLDELRREMHSFILSLEMKLIDFLLNL